MVPMDNRLDSWKEIAAYLKRTERTVNRWEKRGLPVYRVPGAQRQVVFAYKHELDEWLRHGKGKNDGTECEQELELPIAGAELPHRENQSSGSMVPIDSAVESQPSVQSSDSQSVARLKRKVSIGKMILLVFVLVVGISGVTLALINRSPALNVLGFTRLTSDSHDKLNLKTDGKYLYFNQMEGYQETLAAIPVTGGSIRKINSPFPNVDLQDISMTPGHLLGLVYQGTELERPLFYFSVSDAAPGRLGDFTCRWARKSPDNHWLACATGTTMTLVELEHLRAKTIASLRSPITNLGWSPDGRQLRFSVRDVQTNQFSMWQVVIENGKILQPVQLNFGDDCCISWTWINQGKDFVYLKVKADGTRALMIRPEGRLFPWTLREAEIPVNVGAVVDLVPGLRSNELYVLIQDALQSQVLRYKPQERAYEEAFLGKAMGYPAFSPDGKWISYVGSDDALWRSKADGSDAIKLSDAMHVQLSSWSPDGRKIAFIGQRPGTPWRIFIVNRDGGALKEAADGDDGQGTPTWSPDGKKLVYGNVDCSELQTCWVRVIDIDTGKVETLPGSHGYRTARWSPDGNHIAALVPAAHELMLYDIQTRKWHLLGEGVTGDTLNWSSDSKLVYADSPQGDKPLIESFRISDGKRSTVASLRDQKEVSGQLDFWFGLFPDGSLMLNHTFRTTEIYRLEWTGS